MVVYFIQRKSDNAIKIGHSGCLRARRSAIRVSIGEPIDILCAIDGGRPTEKTLHERFSDIRLGGEWFKNTTALLNYIDSLSSECLDIDDIIKSDKPFRTINLKVSEEEYSKLIEKKEKETWESFFLRVAGI